MERERFDKFIKIVLKDLNAAENLLKEEPDLIDATNSIGETVFHYLVVENRLDEVRWLLKNGSKINTTNDFGNTPLSEAASLGYKEMCNFLIKKGADHKIRSENDDTALSEAATRDKIEIVNMLLDLVAPEDKLTDYFDSITYNILVDKESQSAKAIKEKGLSGQ